MTFKSSRSLTCARHLPSSIEFADSRYHPLPVSALGPDAELGDQEAEQVRYGDRAGGDVAPRQCLLAQDARAGMHVRHRDLLFARMPVERKELALRLLLRERVAIRGDLDAPAFTGTGGRIFREGIALLQVEGCPQQATAQVHGCPTIEQQIPGKRRR